MPFPRLFIGPVSKNTIDSVIELCASGFNIGLIPSRRQIDIQKGYVNNFSTKEFVNYLKKRDSKIFLERDHAGPGQGVYEDDGLISLKEDSINNFDMIHIDPWKKNHNLESAIFNTINLINECLKYKKNIIFELGTEESIRKYSPEEFELYLYRIREELGKEKFKSVKFGVVQGGTKLSINKNTGLFNSKKMSEFIHVCNKFNLYSKEHNGDYLTKKDIEKKFNLGLHSLNLAPELGYLESSCILEKLKRSSDSENFEKIYKACLNSKKWEKWIPIKEQNNIIKNNKSLLIKISGHYIFSSKVVQNIKNKYPELDNDIKLIIKNKLKEILCVIK